MLVARLIRQDIQKTKCKIKIYRFQTSSKSPYISKRKKIVEDIEINSIAIITVVGIDTESIWEQIRREQNIGFDAIELSQASLP